MSRAVNHDRRRTQVIDCALDLVAEGGVGAASIRRIAHATGYTTGFVSHYFVDSKQMQTLMFRASAARGRERAIEVASKEPQNLAKILETFLPIDDRRVRDWKAFAAFIGLALSDKYFAALREEEATATRTLIAEAIDVYRASNGKPQKPTIYPSSYEADRLLALIVGVSLETLLNPRRWPRKRLQLLLSEEIALL